MPTGNPAPCGQRLEQCEARVRQWKEYMVLVEWVDPQMIAAIQSLVSIVEESRRHQRALSCDAEAKVCQRTWEEMVADLESCLTDSAIRFGLPLDLPALKSRLYAVA